MKSINAYSHFRKTLKLSLPVLLGSTLLFFQNCGQGGNIQAKDGTVYDEDGVATVPAYSSKSISATDAPPLKIVFLMDNSNSMTLNNLNLQQSLTSMFDNQASSLSQFNADIYFYTTAQLAGLALDFAKQTKSPDDLSNIPLNEIESTMRGPSTFNGLVAGDLLGFTYKRTQTPQRDLVEYVAQPVVAFRESGATRTIYPSIRYAKGSSIDALKANVKERLNIISPERASNLSNASVFNALDTESALCGLARILKNPGQTILPGDISSFVIVSDENEADPSGNNCLYSQQRDYLYKASCQQRVPASATSDTQIAYETKAGANQYRTVFTITPKDATRNKIVTTLAIGRAARGAVCNGIQEREFNVNYQLLQKTYVIKYSKKPLIGTREGGVPIYGTEQTGLTTSSQSGLVPADCSSNLNRLKTVTGDSTSLMTIQSCMQNADSMSAQTTTATYSTYPTVNLSTSTACPAGLVTALSAGGRIIGTCSLARKTEAISSAALTAAGFTSASNESQCRTAISTVCSSNSNLKNCTYSSYSGPTAALASQSASRTENTALTCDASCTQFPSLCPQGSTSTVKAYASSIGATCTASTANSSETWVQTFNPSTVTITAAAGLNCSSTCNEASQACAGNKNTQTVTSYNKVCTAQGPVLVPGATPQTRTIATVVEDADRGINCDTLCSASKGICNGSGTIAQFISTSLNGQNCSARYTNRTVAETVKKQEVKRLKESQLSSDYCPTGFEKDGAPVLTSDYEDSSEKVSGTQTLPEYVLNQLQTRIGNKAATLSAFITPNGASNSALSTSYGQIYESLVKSWGSGSVHDIRSPSYAPALTQLSATLKSQLIRSMVFPEVTGKKKIRQVWHRSKNETDWQLLLPNLWSATGGTVTLDKAIELDLDDEIKIEYF